MPRDLNAFFCHYISAYDAASPAMIAAYFEIPAAVLDADGPQVFATREALEEKFSSYCEHFAAIGYESARYFKGHYEELGDAGAFIDLGWQIRTATTVEEFRTAYLLHRHTDGWLIFSASAYDGVANLTGT